MNQQIISWVKHDTSSSAAFIRCAYRWVTNPSLPAMRWLFKPLHILHNAIVTGTNYLARVFYYTPIFKTQLTNQPKNLYLYSGMPQILGKLDIEIGDHVRMSGISTFCGRAASTATPQLRIGNNVDVGWQNSISVGTVVELHDNVRLAGRVFLAGFPGHPICPHARAHGLPETDEQAKAIVLEQDVWVGTGATILAGVRIGRGSIIAAGSVVTKDMPSASLIAGNPAKVVKKLEVA